MSGERDQEQDRQHGTVVPGEKTPGPEREPTGELGGEPINAHETAPRGIVPEPDESAGTQRHPEAVEDEPGGDL
jgi:hypothetical protein